jgi:predicted DNA-binding transcriptional regulator
MSTELLADYLVLYHLKLQHFSLAHFQYVIFNYLPEMTTRVAEICRKVCIEELFH